MSVATRMLRKAARKAMTRLLDKVGGRLVSGLADTSSDAPSAVFEPKRNLYEKMRAEEDAPRPISDR